MLKEDVYVLFLCTRCISELHCSVNEKHIGPKGATCMVSAKFHFFQKLLASRLECLSPEYTVKKPCLWRKHGVVNIKKPLEEQDVTR